MMQELCCAWSVGHCLEQNIFLSAFPLSHQVQTTIIQFDCNGFPFLFFWIWFVEGKKKRLMSFWKRLTLHLSHDAGIVLCLVCRSLPWAKYFPVCLPNQSSSTNYNHSVWLQWLPIPFFLNLICRGEKRKDWWAFERDWWTSGDTGWRERRTQSISEMGQRKKVNSTQL